MVALVQNDVPIRLGRFCGGSLVGSKYVVPLPLQSLPHSHSARRPEGCLVKLIYIISFNYFLRLG